MSELNEYLEGKITFEEFERRREERKAKAKVILSVFIHVTIVNLMYIHALHSASM